MIRAVATSTALQVLSLALGMAERILVSALMLRVWGVGVFEDWSVLIATAALLGFLDVGLHQTFSNSYANALQGGRPQEIRRRIAVAVAITGLVAVVGVAIVGAASLELATVGATDQHAIAGAARAIAFSLLGLVVIAQTFSPVIVALYRAESRYSRGIAVDVGASAVRLAATLACVAQGGGPVVVAAVQLAIFSFVCFVLIPFDLRRLDDRLRFVPELPTKDEIMEVARTAPQFYAQHIANIVLLNVPVLAISVLAQSGLLATFVLSIRSYFLCNICAITVLFLCI